MFGPNHNVVNLSWDDGRSPGHKMSVGGFCQSNLG